MTLFPWYDSRNPLDGTPWPCDKQNDGADTINTGDMSLRTAGQLIHF